VACIEIWRTLLFDKRLGKIRGEGRISGKQRTIS
jgi:hypothetical protein